MEVLQANLKTKLLTGIASKRAALESRASENQLVREKISSYFLEVLACMIAVALY